MDLKDVLHSVRSGWWLLLSGFLIGLVVAGALSWAATPLYGSSAQLFVSTAGTTDTSAAYQGNLFSQQRVTSYAELLTGQQLAERVVDELDLELTPAQVAAKVSARALPDTVILEVTVTDTSPERAQAIAAELGEQFALRVAEIETPVGADVSTVKVEMIEEPKLVADAVSPDVARNLGLGAVLGLLIGLGLALLRSRLDNTVKSSDDVLAITGTGLIGTVLDDPRLDQQHVVASADEHSLTAEAFRAIRTNLQFLDVDNPPRVIVVASSLPGEGKSTLAVNLSTALAQAGNRVMLIEADLRRPRVTRYLGLVGGAGLTNVLAGSADLHEVAQPWGDGKLRVLAAGPMPPNPSEMLGSAQMRSLLDSLRDSEDFVVIDTPPLLPVTDGAVLSVLADGCVITTRYGTTRREQLAEATATLARIDAKLLGVVLNRVPQAASVAQGYGYGYGYASDPGRSVPLTAAGSRASGRRRKPKAEKAEKTETPRDGGAVTS